MRFADMYKLINGVEIPLMGFGTYLTPPDGTTARSVRDAINAGYCMIDTAFAYKNEEDLARGIKMSSKARKDIFITTKHWVTNRGYKKTLEAIDTSLKNLDTDYIDLYLIHWPCVEKTHPDWKEQNADTWRGFEKAYKDGKLRSIGVSNFEKKHLDALYETCEIKPMVNQIEYHPGFIQQKTLEFSRENGMYVEAYYPLGSGQLLELEEVKVIAEKYGKTAAQILLRFSLQSGCIPLVKSTHKSRILENTQIFDFALTENDMEILYKIPQPTAFSGWFADEAPADAIAAAQQTKKMAKDGKRCKDSKVNSLT